MFENRAVPYWVRMAVARTAKEIGDFAPLTPETDIEII
jgi:hypothetical protein